MNRIIQKAMLVNTLYLMQKYRLPIQPLLAVAILIHGMCVVPIQAEYAPAVVARRLEALPKTSSSLFEDDSPEIKKVRRFDEIDSEPTFTIISSRSPSIFESNEPTPRTKPIIKRKASSTTPEQGVPRMVRLDDLAFPKTPDMPDEIAVSNDPASLTPQSLPLEQQRISDSTIPGLDQGYLTKPVEILEPTAPVAEPQLDMPESSSITAAPNTGGPGNPWWESNVGSALRPTQQQLHVSLNTLLVSALANSAQIQLISDAPLISETEITTTDAAFDWTSFVDARWDDLSEPVGSTLTTGGPDRLRDHNANIELGVRRRNTIGGEFEIGQRFGHQDNNSTFFIPRDQGSARLTLSYTQPLLRGAGRVYNTSLTVLAQLRTKLDRNQFESQLQDHLLSITQEYWTLYFERARHLQNQKLLENGEKVFKEIESRKDVDALQSQVVRARAAVENRRALLIRSQLSIRMAEARLRALVNDPSLGNTLSTELIPQEHFQAGIFPVDLESAVATALRNRPEVEVAIQDVKSASVRMNMGKREALPMLNVVLESYASGLEGESKVGQAFMEQFNTGEPTYGIGLQYEYPIWNRAASSRVQKRRLELRRIHHQFRQTIESMRLEVELAVHQVHAAYESLEAKRRAMEAASDEVAYLFDRWQLLPTDNGSASLLLEDLLEAQDRLSDSELGLLQALLDHNLAQVEFKRAVGTLLGHHQITIDRNCNCNLPQQQIMKSVGAPIDALQLPTSMSIPMPVQSAPNATSTPAVWSEPVPFNSPSQIPGIQTPPLETMQSPQPSDPNLTFPTPLQSTKNVWADSPRHAKRPGSITK